MNYQMYGGIKVFESTALQEFMQVPIKKLENKRWHKNSRSNYSKRIQKKWNKRFGQKNTPYFLQTAQGIFMHPATFKRFCQAIEEKEKTPASNPYEYWRLHYDN